VVAVSLRAFARAPAPAALVAFLAGAIVPGAALAQFNMVPPPLCRAPAAAASADAAAYRVEASRHVYDCFPGRVYPDVLPPLVYGIVSVETEIDDRGRIVALNVLRRPAAEEVEPWVLAMLRRAAPYPAPVKLPGGTARFIETFLVDRSGLFQTLALTEGQLGSTPKELLLPLSGPASTNASP
jgi:hypothetical protein